MKEELDGKTTWSGSRSGAGRKAKPHGKPYTFLSTPEMDAILSAYEGNKNEFINKAILFFSKL
jgi:hypothetical protein